MLGIRTNENTQMVFVDTPGLQHEIRRAGDGRAINRYMNRVATSSIADVDVVVFVLERDRWEDGDEFVLEQILRHAAPDSKRPSGGPAPTVICAINKIDRLDRKDELLPILAQLSARLPFAELIPVSALGNDNLDVLAACIEQKLPMAPFFFADDQVTDRDVRYLASELVREKVVRQLGQELPYRSAVVIERFVEEPDLITINAVIYVERPGQKAIVIGAGGQRLKLVGEAARKDLEAMLECRVMLSLWVKVRSEWSDSEAGIRFMGYG